jgi:hypothetical protein
MNAGAEKRKAAATLACREDTNLLASASGSTPGGQVTQEKPDACVSRGGHAANTTPEGAVQELVSRRLAAVQARVTSPCDLFSPSLRSSVLVTMTGIVHLDGRHRRNASQG